MELNEKNLKTCQPGDVLRDPTIRGLQVRATPSGKKVFMLYYRTKAGKERRPKLGEYGSITLSQARDAARTMLAAIAVGKDPMADREKEQAEPTIADLWTRYEAAVVSRRKARTQESYKTAYRLHIEPKLGRKRLSEIRPFTVDDLRDGMADKPYQANRVLAVLSAMFNYAIKRMEWAGNNPVRGSERFAEVKRKRYMTAEEVARVAELLIAEEKENLFTSAFIQLLIMTGARKGEIAAAKWDQIRGNMIFLPDSKTGEKEIYLSPQALDVLAKLPRTNGTLTGISHPKKLWDKIRTEAGCPDLRIHDLRHSFASAGLAAGLSLAQIGGLLGHKSTQTTHRYAHLVEEAGVAAATTVGDLMELRMKQRVSLPADTGS